jgi:hypothetical protein
VERLKKRLLWRSLDVIECKEEPTLKDPGLLKQEKTTGHLEHRPQTHNTLVEVRYIAATRGPDMGGGAL